MLSENSIAQTIYHKQMVNVNPFHVELSEHLYFLIVINTLATL